jgi:hypothetical protein
MCNHIPSHTSAARGRRTRPYITLDFQFSDTLRAQGYTSFTPIVKKTTQSTGNEQLASQFDHQSSTMPPKKAARGQLRLGSLRSRTENLRSPLGRVIRILTRGASVPPEDAIHDEDQHDDEENTADMKDALSDVLGDNLSDVLGDNPSEPEPTTQSEIASMRKMMEVQRVMLNNASQQNTQLCVQNAELMEANREYRRESIRPEATKTKIFDMTHPERYCGGAKELDNFLDTLRSNFQSHTHLFPHRDPDKVKYSASLLSTWNNHPDPAQRQTQINEPVEWLQDLRRDSDPCLEDFKAFSEEMQKTYSDKHRKLNAAMKCMTHFLQGANEPVRVYANRIKADWRAAGWLPQDNKNLYDIAWSGPRPPLQSKIKPLTPKNGIFDSMEELVDRAADSEVKPDGKKPQPQQPQQQQKQSGESSSQQGGKKRNFQPSISELAEAPKPDKSKSDKDDKRTPAPWVSPELYESCRSEGKCIRCG